jgi:hypothetical protein
MRSHYDFTDAVKNPYIKKLKKTVTMKLADVLKKSRKAINKGGGIPHDEFWKKMGV